jgi:hypothetical protein
MINQAVGIASPTSLLSFNEKVTITCNKGYFFKPNATYVP